MKMRELIRIIFVCLCVIVLVRDVRCEDVAEVALEEPRGEEQGDLKKDPKSALPGTAKRPTTQSSSNATRDSQLLSLLAARRRQALKGRLVTHLNTFTTLAQKANKINATSGHLEVRDANGSTVKRLSIDNSSIESPTLKFVSTAADGTREFRQDVKPHEIRHLFIPKTYQENRSRSGFLNNRRKESLNKAVTLADVITESAIVYFPPEKLEGLEKEVELDPEEEFQVDESNHGLYLLNYSDTDNITNPNTKTTTVSYETTENSSLIAENVTLATIISKEITTIQPEKEASDEKIDVNVILNPNVTKNTKLIQVENEKDKENHTLFMSDEIYNHFRPLESELPVEEMAPFIYFGQKLGGQSISDNLTDSPSLSASTKTVNFIVAPPDKRKFNSRYSVTEKYINTSASVDEEEINEEMDVSVVKNIIEKNKIRNTVKGPAPARHVGLVNAYRKYSTTTPVPLTTSKGLNIGQLNVTEPILQNITPSPIEKIRGNNKTNATNTNRESFKLNLNSTLKDVIINKTNAVLTSRNFTRSYFNLKRRPSRITAAPSTEINLPLIVSNATTEKASTSVYTAVVTSVSITSSMKGHNKTDPSYIDTDNTTVIETVEVPINITTPKVIIINETETTTPTTTTAKQFRHRIRIRTTTTESSLNFNPIPSTSPLTSAAVNNVSELKSESTTSKISERLANLFRQNDYDDTISNGTIKPKNILKRRRPTTTSTVTPPITTAKIQSNSPSVANTLPANIFTTETSETTEISFKPFVVTSRTSSESRSKPLLIPSNASMLSENSSSNKTDDNEGENVGSQNEEVVIEAEKTYTASYVLAGLGFLPVAAIIAFVLKSVLNKKTKELDTEYEGYFDDGDIKKESPITPVARPPLPTPTKPDQKWEFPRNKLRLQTLLGQGNFGQVWKAEADDLNGHDGLTRLVAVKSIKETASQKEKQELLHEINIMQKIGTHPNVVTLLACCTEQEPYLLLMEYVMCGKLLTYLRERRSRPDRFSGSGALTSRDLTVFAYCVARGMDYIASKGIVHRDLAARNVLVDHNKLCKIADFGMSRCAGAGARTARGALPVRWMAPEALLYNVYSTHTDVWAFGILLWEIVTLGSTPYAAMSGREVLAAVTEGYRLERPPHCKPQLYRAMHSCWHADPSQRPTFAALKGQLADLLDNEPSEGNYVDLDSFYQESSVYSDPSAIINDDEGLSAEYDRERRCFRELQTGPVKFGNENRAFSFRDEELRNKFGIGTPRMGGFGIRDVPFNERNFSDGEFNERNFSDKNFTERNFTDNNFNDTNFTERKDGKLSTSSFHKDRERERDNPLVSRNSFNGFPRIGTRETHFQMTPDGRNKRVSEFECDI